MLQQVRRKEKEKVMLLPYLILGSALSISGVAIYFSIAGLVTIFPGAFWPIVIMGTVLEVGKLVCASWLHHNWKDAPRSLKLYLTVAVVVLIGITSMGIFGFLSKSHIEQQREVLQSSSAIEQVEAQIKNEEAYVLRQQEFIRKSAEKEESITGRADINIELEQKKITDLQNSLASSIKYDEQELNRLNGSLSKLDDEVALLQASKGGIFSNKDKKVKELIESQKPQRELFRNKSSAVEDRIQASRVKYEDAISAVRNRIEAFQANAVINEVEDPKSEEYEGNIRSAHARIVEFQAQKFQHESDLANLEVEVGPIKYIAALIEDMGVENIMLAEAVRVVILILVFVFDPLAVVMLLAANMNFRQSGLGSYEKLSHQITNKKSKKKRKKKREKLKSITATNLFITTTSTTSSTLTPTTTTAAPTTTTTTNTPTATSLSPSTTPAPLVSTGERAELKYNILKNL